MGFYYNFNKLLDILKNIKKGLKMENTQKKSGLTNFIRYGYGVGDMLSALASSVYSYYLTFYLSNVAMLSLEKVALLTGICSVYDICTAWLYGALLNAGKPGKYGRYRTQYSMIIPFPHCS